MGTREDIEEIDQLFYDAKSSAKLLAANADKYISKARGYRPSESFLLLARRSESSQSHASNFSIDRSIFRLSFRKKAFRSQFASPRGSASTKVARGERPGTRAGICVEL